MKKTFQPTILAFIFFYISLLISCQSIEETIPPHLKEKQIPSLIDIYPDIYYQAQKWDTEAILTSVSIGVGTKMIDITFSFTSPNDLHNGLIVKYETNGIISTKKIEYNFPRADSKANNFIEMTKVKIDSIEAWNIFLEHPEILSYEEKNFECAELLLLPNGGGNSIWRLSIGECEASSHDFFHLDAATGEWLGSDLP